MNQPDNEEPFSQSMSEEPAPKDAIPIHLLRASTRIRSRRKWAILVLLT